MLIEHNSIRNLGYNNIQTQQENGHRGDYNTKRIIDSTLISNVFRIIIIIIIIKQYLKYASRSAYSNNTVYITEMEPVGIFMTRPDRCSWKFDPTRPAGRPVNHS